MISLQVSPKNTIKEHEDFSAGINENEIFLKDIDPQTGEVKVSSSVVNLNDYLQITPEDDRLRLLELAGSLGDRKISFVNATAAGGGVAIMRTSQIFLFTQLGVDAHWFVTEPDDAVFRVTKGKFHNVFQGVANVGVTASDAKIYSDWIDHNAKRMGKTLAKSDVVVIDDPQPAGLILHIKKINPGAKIIFRNHIQSLGSLMGLEGTPQFQSWSFLWNNNGVSKADLYVYHPVEDFIPDNVPPEKTVLMPPSTDFLDGLNRPLTESEIGKGIAFFNEMLRLNENQTPLDLSRPYIIQIARFDPSKGIEDVLKAYSLLCKRMVEGGFKKELIPQLVIVGNGSVDDPDGAPVLEDTMRRRSELYGDIADDIKVAKIPHNDKALNALLRKCYLAVQLSTREGFEFKVTEAAMKGKPVIASKAGGIPLQVVHGKSGYLVKPEDSLQAAKYMFTLMTKPDTYKRLGAGAFKIAATRNYEFTTVPNVINWLWLIRELLENPNFKGNRRDVREMVKGKFSVFSG